MKRLELFCGSQKAPVIKNAKLGAGVKLPGKKQLLPTLGNSISAIRLQTNSVTMGDNSISHQLALNKTNILDTLIEDQSAPGEDRTALQQVQQAIEEYRYKIKRVR